LAGTLPGGRSAKRGSSRAHDRPCSRAGELLDAVVACVRHVDVPAPVDRHAGGSLELSVARALAPPGGEEGAARVELLDAGRRRVRAWVRVWIALRLRDVDVPAAVGRHAVEVVHEVPTSPTRNRQGGEEGAARVELLDAMVARICDVDVPAAVGRHAPGGGELSVVRAVAPPGGEEGAARVELLDAVVARVRDVDIPAAVGRHAPGGGELSVARALAPPRGEEGAVRVELLDAVVVRIRDVDMPARVGGHTVGVAKLS